MRKHRTSPTRSIASRLTIRVMLTIVLVFAAIATLIFGVTWAFLVFMMTKSCEEMLEMSNERINNAFMAAEVAITNITPDVQNSLENPNKMYTITERILSINPNIAGSAIAFEQNFYPQKGVYFSPYSYRDGNTIKSKQLGNEDYEYHYMDWYQIPKLLEKPGWSEPYFDEGGGDIPMTTYSLPLFNSYGEMYAVITADISLEWIADMMQQADSINNHNDLFLDDETRHAYSFLIGRGGTYIVHPDKKRVLNESIFSYCMETQSEKDDTVAYRMIHGEQGWTKMTENDETYLIFYAPIKRLGWSMAIMVPKDEILSIANKFVFVLILIMLIGLIIIFVVCHYGIKRVTKPLTLFTNSADEIAKGHFNSELPEIKTKDEMLRLRNSFETMQKSLVQQIEQTKAINEEKGRIESELHIARNIQMSMLPKVFPPYPDRSDIEIFGQLQPAKEVGGDLYDFYIRDEKLFFCIGDVSGKGVPASLVMAVTRAQFRIISGHETMPDRIVSTINDNMADNNENMFVTLFVGVLDLPTGRMRYTNAGHNAPLLIDGRGSRLGMLPIEPNLPIGVMEGWKFTLQEAIIDPQTTIFLYTDGLTEAEDIDHQQFGEERVLATAQPLHPKELIERMATAVKDFVGNAEQSDDLTMLAIQYTKQQLDIHLQRSITLTNNVEEVAKLSEFVDEVCEAVGFDMSTTMSMNLAMEEAVVNVIDYAYPNTTGNINITAEANEQRLKFIISDNGIPFDPTTKAEVDITLNVEDRPIGGLGIHLVRQIMDSINYERIDGKNVLTLRKTIKTPEANNE